MKTFIIEETREVIEAFTTETFEVEAETEEEAMEMVENRDVDSIEYDVDVRQTEVITTEVTIKN